MPFKHIHIAAIILTAGAALAMLVAMSTDAEANKQNQPISKVSLPNAHSTATRTTLPLSVPASITATSPADKILTEENIDYDYKTIKVKKGDTLTHVLQRAGLKNAQINEIVNADIEIKKITRLTPGQKFEVAANQTGELQHLIYHPDKTNKYMLSKTNNAFALNHEKRKYERRITHASATIETSLFEAAVEAGLSDNITMDLAHIFGWDIDFALDIRENDHFTVLYEQLYLDGEHAGSGNIIAAEFNTQGKNHTALRYTDKQGNSSYYSADGKSMRKAFLRTPVDFTRISSRFGNRYHPTLKRKKAHKGVDYAAPRGTPIKAAGDGKIIWRATKGGYGKTIIIKHGSKYSTLYAHMKSYNRKARNGSQVKQGQVIGYVGTTGRSTGPHLHYEFRVNGAHRNPLTVKLPDAKSIPKKDRNDFLNQSRPLLAQLDLVKTMRLADSNVQ